MRAIGLVYGKHKTISQSVKSVVFLVMLIMVIPSSTNITTAIASAADLVNKTNNVASQAILLSNKGNDLFKLGNFREAIKYYDIASAANPNSINALNNRIRLILSLEALIH